MKYQDFIANILNERGHNGIPKGVYKEKHHIIPRCLGGSNSKDNLIDLYPSEHFIAHKLLAEENVNNFALVKAYWLLSNLKDGRQIQTPQEYEMIRTLYSKMQSKKMKKDFVNDKDKRLSMGKIKGKHCYTNGEINVYAFECPNGFRLGRTINEKQRKALDNLHKSRKGKPSWNKGKTNIYSEETKKKMGAKNIGKVNKEHLEKLHKINKGNTYCKGKKLSEEHKKKISNSLKGKNVGAKNGMYGKIPWNKKKGE